MTCPTCGHDDHTEAVCMVVVPCDDDQCAMHAHHCACAYPDDNAVWVPVVASLPGPAGGLGETPR